MAACSNNWPHVRMVWRCALVRRAAGRSGDVQHGHVQPDPAEHPEDGPRYGVRGGGVRLHDTVQRVRVQARTAELGLGSALQLTPITAVLPSTLAPEHLEMGAARPARRSRGLAEAIVQRACAIAHPSAPKGPGGPLHTATCSLVQLRRPWLACQQMGSPTAACVPAMTRRSDGMRKRVRRGSCRVWAAPSLSRLECGSPRTERAMEAAVPW